MSTNAEPLKPDQRFPRSEWPPSLAEAVVACLCLRDLLRLRKHYPNAMRADDAAELQSALLDHLGVVLAKLDLESGRARPRSVNRDTPVNEVHLTQCFNALLIDVPGVLRKAGEAWTSEERIRRVIAACQERIGPRLRDLAQQLVDVKLYDCRIPDGDATFADPRRSVQMVREYWSIASSLVLHQMDAQVAIQPHPLLRMIVGLRARIDGYFERLGDDAEVRAARDAAAYLLDAVSGSEPDELSAVPDSTQAQVHVVHRCIEDLRLKAGSKVFPLTHEEETFLAHARTSVEQHHLEVEKAWRRMVATAVKTAKDYSEPVASPTTASGTSPLKSSAVVVAAQPVGNLGGSAPASVQAASAPVDRYGAAEAADVKHPRKPAAEPSLGPNVFARKGDRVWQLRFSGGKDFVLIRSKGAAYLHLLMSSPGTPISSLKLAATVASQPEEFLLGDAGETSDAESMTAFRAHHEELKEEIARARADKDLTRVAQIQEDMSVLVKRINVSRSPGGRLRKDADNRDRVRKAVGNAIARVVKEIGKYDKALAEHLRSPILRRGMHPCYSPSPSVDWRLA